MKRIITTEDVRRSEYRAINMTTWYVISTLILLGTMILNLIYLQNFNTVFSILRTLTDISLVLAIVCLVWSLLRSRKIDKKFGKKLKQELGIERLTFTKLKDNTLELHHNSFGKKEIKNFKKNGLSESDIKNLLKNQLIEDFKKLEAFLQEEAKKSDGLIVTTFTHVAMFRVWNKRAREAGISFEVVEDHYQKPVGFQWWDWKRVVYRTTGGKAKKDSIPKSEDWKMYRLRSKCL